MSRTENPALVTEKLMQQNKPSIEGTLKTCVCEIGNVLDQNILPPELRQVFEDLYEQAKKALPS